MGFLSAKTSHRGVQQTNQRSPIFFRRFLSSCPSSNNNAVPRKSLSSGKADCMIGVRLFAPAKL